MYEKEKGITLIALIITIIVMLILVGVTVNVAINGGLFSTAKKATAEMQFETDKESLLSAVIGAIDNNSEVNFTELDANLPQGFTGTDGTYTSKAGNTFYVDKSGNITDVELPNGGDYKPASELFEAEKEKLSAIEDKNDFTTDGKLHIGDFINYDAGKWTQDEINAIQTGENSNLQTANGSKNLPTGDFQFGGFIADHSRNGNAVPDGSSYNYYKDSSNNQPITGWRLFDLDEEGGTITLISAGCPEDFYVPSSSYDDGNGGYISEYILSGNINSNAKSLNLDSSYIKRDWEKYVNKGQHATSANAITKTDLDNWYNKYMGVSGANTFDDDTFQKIYKMRYENLIDNYSYYWLASAYGGNSHVCFVKPNYRLVRRLLSHAYGVRVLVTLPSNIQLSKDGEKTVANITDDENRSDKSYTYNVWNIQ